MFGYLFLVFAFLLLFSLSFYFGIREWLKPEDDTPIPVDVEYVRVENYVGESFRSKMQEWLESAQQLEVQEPLEPPVEAVLEKTNGERILLLNSGSFGGGRNYEELLICEGSLSLEDRSEFRREIYCRGRLETGAGVRLQAVASDGEIILGPDNEVFRWVDSHAKITLQHGTVVHARVSAQESIQLDTNVKVQSLYAPLISTYGYQPTEKFPHMDEDISTVLEEGQAGNVPEGWPSTVARLAADTLLIRGDLDLKPGSLVDSNLIVQGTLRSGAGCIFVGDVKAGKVELGTRNQANRNVVSGSSLTVGESCFIGRTVVAETDIRLSDRVRVGRPEKLTVVSAGREIRIGQNVAVWGKVAAGTMVSVVEGV